MICPVPETYEDAKVLSAIIRQETNMWTAYAPTAVYVGYQNGNWQAQLEYHWKHNLIKKIEQYKILVRWATYRIGS